MKRKPKRDDPQAYEISEFHQAMQKMQEALADNNAGRETKYAKWELIQMGGLMLRYIDYLMHIPPFGKAPEPPQ